MPEQRGGTARQSAIYVLALNTIQICEKNCTLYMLIVQFIVCLVFMCSMYAWTSFFSS